VADQSDRAVGGRMDGQPPAEVNPDSLLGREEEVVEIQLSLEKSYLSTVSVFRDIIPEKCEKWFDWKKSSGRQGFEGVETIQIVTGGRIEICFKEEDTKDILPGHQIRCVDSDGSRYTT